MEQELQAIQEPQEQLAQLEIQEQQEIQALLEQLEPQEQLAQLEIEEIQAQLVTLVLVVQEVAPLHQQRLQAQDRLETQVELVL